MGGAQVIVPETGQSLGRCLGCVVLGGVILPLCGVRFFLQEAGVFGHTYLKTRMRARGQCNDIEQEIIRNDLCLPAQVQKITTDSLR